MKLTFVGAALLISVLSTDAQHYIPDLPPPWPLRYLGSAENPGFRDDVPFGNFIPQTSPSWLFRRFGSTGPSRRFGSDWLSRRFGSEWPFGSIGLEGPSRRFGSDWLSRRFGLEGPSRRFGSDWLSRRFGSEWPFGRIGLERPSRLFGSNWLSRRFGSEENPGFRDEAYILKSILRHSLRKLSRSLSLAENPDYWDDVSFRKSIPQRLPFWFPRSFGSAWPFRHFASADCFRSEKLIHMLGKLIDICKKIFDRKRPWTRRRNPLKIIPTFKISCGNPTNLNHQPYLPTYGNLGFPQGYPFYPQGFPFYPQGYLSYSQGYPEVGIAQQSLPVVTQPFAPVVPPYYPSSSIYPGIASPDYPGTQQSNYWNPSNPLMKSYPSLVPPEPFPAQPLFPMQPQPGNVPSILYSPQNSAGVALSPPPQYVPPPLAQGAPFAFAQRARPAPPLRARPAPPLRARPASAQRVYPALTRVPVASVSSVIPSPDTSVLPASEDPEYYASEAPASFGKKTSALKGPTSQKSPETKPLTTEDGKVTELDI